MVRVLLVVTGLLALIVPSTAVAAGDFSCRGSAARVTALTPDSPLATSEPIVANATGTPCTTQDASTVKRTTVGPIEVEAGAAFSARAVDGAGALGSVADAKVSLPGLVIQAKALVASAQIGCAGDPSGASSVVDLVINGQTIAIPPGPVSIPLSPLVEVALNEEVNDGGLYTRRALRVSTAVAEVVIAEAVVGRAGDPCAPGGTTGGGGLLPGNNPGGPNPCPQGATYEPDRNLCVIREANGSVIIVGRPHQGPYGGTVVSLTEARKRSNSRCLYGSGPAFAVLGTNKNDAITGTNARDRIVLLAGNDRSEGGRGDDCIDGGSGVDTLSGALGKDTLYGGSGRDHLVGGSHADRLIAGSGNDTINSGFGKDYVHGGSGDDAINVATAGPAARRLHCGSGRRDKIRLNRNEFRRARGCETRHVIR